MISCSLNL
jgi:hypothetical protein